LRKLVLFLVLIGALSAAAWYLSNREQLREVVFARPVRKDIVSTLNTNGRVEPLNAVTLRSDRDAKLAGIHVALGDRVRAGQLVVVFDTVDIENEIPVAEAKIAQARAELTLFERGGKPAALTEIETSIAASRLRLSAARRDLETVRRLVAKGAATRRELTEIEDRIRQDTGEIEAADQKRRSLLAPEDRRSVEARIVEATAALESLRSRAARAKVYSPAAGDVFHLPVKPGAFLRAGETIAQIGDGRRLRLTILVDEPELGRVSKGMPVQVSWDGRPGDAWEGTVERLPSQVTPVGSRQVGEVLAEIANADLRLPPGSNVNVRIRTGFSAMALTVPRGAVRRAGDSAGVLLLDGDRLRWQPVQLGQSSATDTALIDGVRETDAVAMPTENPLRNGEKVLARFQ
jgi:HlyD family secretion protein